MISHVSLGVRELERAARFYDAVLEPMGYVRVWCHPDAVGYGEPGGDDRLALFQRSDARGAGPGFHLAFEAPTEAAVEAFHAAALAGGGTDDGTPGLRPQYGSGYYAAFVRDPDGHKLEAVHHCT
ncbi:MAG: VOC family protein [Candidatus Eremiobacterota bacterium]